MDTLERLGANVIQFFIVVIAALMILDKLGLSIGPALAGLGVIGSPSASAPRRSSVTT
jgi:small-conductance mechanosensitive channel